MALTTVASPRFLVDRNVGRLCKWLRAMSYDATFAGPEDDGAIVGAALREGRALVTALTDSIAFEYRQVVQAALEARDSELSVRRRTLSRLRREMHRIRARDYFPTGERREAEAAIELLAATAEVLA